MVDAQRLKGQFMQIERAHVRRVIHKNSFKILALFIPITCEQNRVIIKTKQ